MVIDMTGGQKSVSVAATLATLHCETHVQYMRQTDGEMVQYDSTLRRPVVGA